MEQSDASDSEKMLDSEIEGSEKKTRSTTTRRRKRRKLKDVPEEKGIPFDKALFMLKEADVPDLTSRSSLRRAFHLKTIPGFIHGKNRIYFATNAILELVGTAVTNKKKESIDQALMRHFRESPSHNPFTALEAKIVPSLAKAMTAFREFHVAKSDPLVIASEHVGSPNQIEKSGERTKAEPTCNSCRRSQSAATEEHRRINRAITGDRDALDLTEEHALGKFQGLRCPECWNWQSQAPIALMHQELRALEAPRKIPDRDRLVSPTQPLRDGVRSSDDASATPKGGGDIEEVTSPSAETKAS